MAIPAYSTDIDNTPAQQPKFSVGIVKGLNIPAFTNATLLHVPMSNMIENKLNRLVLL